MHPQHGFFTPVHFSSRRSLTLSHSFVCCCMHEYWFTGLTPSFLSSFLSWGAFFFCPRNNEDSFSAAGDSHGRRACMTDRDVSNLQQTCRTEWIETVLKEKTEQLKTNPLLGAAKSRGKSGVIRRAFLQGHLLALYFWWFVHHNQYLVTS
jgi:hypothetical protein